MRRRPRGLSIHHPRRQPRYEPDHHGRRRRGPHPHVPGRRGLPDLLALGTSAGRTAAPRTALPYPFRGMRRAPDPDDSRRGDDGSGPVHPSLRARRRLLLRGRGLGAKLGGPSDPHRHRGRVLGTSSSTFAPQAPLTQAALADAVRATAALQHPAAPAPPAPAPVTVLSTVGAGATVGGTVPLEIQAPNRSVVRVDFAVDGTEVGTALAAPYLLQLDTSRLVDGLHQLAVNVSFDGGGNAIAVWQVTVANAPGSVATAPTAPVALPIAKSSLPAAAPATTTQPATQHGLYRAVFPTRPVSVKQLDAALVGYLGLGAAARKIQATLQQAGLQPPPNTGTEAVARTARPTPQSSGRPGRPRASARPARDARRSRILVRAAPAARSRVAGHGSDRRPTHSASRRSRPGSGGSSPPPCTTSATRTSGAARAPRPRRCSAFIPSGGFDCSGFVWRVYKLTPYPGERGLADVLRGRTTYQMSGEVPHRDLLHGRAAAAGRRDVLRRARPALEPERGRSHRPVSRQRLVHPVERRGCDPAPLRRLVHDELRLGPPPATGGGPRRLTGLRRRRGTAVPFRIRSVWNGARRPPI